MSANLDYVIPGNSFSLLPAIRAAVKFVAEHFPKCTAQAVADCCHCQINFLAKTALDYHVRLSQLNSQHNDLRERLEKLVEKWETFSKEIAPKDAELTMRDCAAELQQSLTQTKGQ